MTPYEYHCDYLTHGYEASGSEQFLLLEQVEILNKFDFNFYLENDIFQEVFIVNISLNIFFV